MNWFFYGLALLWLLDAMRLRGRAAAFRLLKPSKDPIAVDHHFITAPGVVLDDATRQAASAFATAERLQVVDLVPQDTPALSVMRLVQIVDPRSYRTERFARGGTVGQAMLVSADVMSRAGIKAGPAESRTAFVRAARTLKRYACTATDLAVAPSLKSFPEKADERWLLVRELTGEAWPLVAVLHPLLLVLMLAGPFIAVKAGAAALVAYCLQPLIIGAGLRIHSGDLVAMVFLRIPIEFRDWLPAVRNLRRAPLSKDPVEVRRPLYESLLGNGLSHFFEGRRADCPICGSRQLSVALQTRDLLQCKPGRFTLERCGACGHLFQNPRLSVEGLNFYYRDFYDGLGEQSIGFIFDSSSAAYVARARMASGEVEPRRWLDVGTGHGHFCCAAQEVWPATEFHGLDISEAVEEAQRAGWIRRSIRGQLTTLAPDLSETYDVVSMFHYLEHTLNPRTELSSARTALRSGGLLIIEVPNPECAYAPWLGRFWIPWFQPQHLHFLSAANLQNLMKEEGFEPIAVDFVNAHLPADFFFATRLFFRWFLPDVGKPWRHRSSAAARVVYWSAWTLFAPVSVFAMMMDLAGMFVFRRMGISNAYRIAARRKPGG